MNYFPKGLQLIKTNDFSESAYSKSTQEGFWSKKLLGVYEVHTNEKFRFYHT